MQKQMQIKWFNYRFYTLNKSDRRHVSFVQGSRRYQEENQNEIESRQVACFTSFDM
jgi:hypothetical protein